MQIQTGCQQCERAHPGMDATAVREHVRQLCESISQRAYKARAFLPRESFHTSGGLPQTLEQHRNRSIPFFPRAVGAHTHISGGHLPSAFPALVAPSASSGPQPAPHSHRQKKSETVLTTTWQPNLHNPLTPDLLLAATSMWIRHVAANG
eukprot:1124627-Pelagomonas_calceolata.AAC.1